MLLIKKLLTINLDDGRSLIGFMVCVLTFSNSYMCAESAMRKS